MLFFWGFYDLTVLINQAPHGILFSDLFNISGEFLDA
jgi:hypothetical protein